MRNLLLLTLFLPLVGVSQSQISVSSQGLTPEELIEAIFEDENLQISNIEYHGNPEQIGWFNNHDSNLTIDSGLVLATGGKEFIVGPNDQSSATAGLDNPQSLGDSDLDSLIPFDVNLTHSAIIEFDFTSTEDSVIFPYSFGSEEYNEFTCTVFSDIFGMFLSGPGIEGDFSNNAINIARLPGSNAPIGINSVNQGFPNNDSSPNGSESLCLELNENYESDNIYFINNVDNTSEYATQLDGFTVQLEAVAQVVPGETYHLKIAISDAMDYVFDSSVIFESRNPFEYDCQSLAANVGEPCNDDNPYSENDSITLNCECQGISPDPVYFTSQPNSGTTISPYQPAFTDMSLITNFDTINTAKLYVYWSDDQFLNEEDSLIGIQYDEFINDSLSLDAYEYPLPLYDYEFYLIYKLEELNGFPVEQILNAYYEINFPVPEGRILTIDAPTDTIFTTVDNESVDIEFKLMSLGPVWLDTPLIKLYWSDQGGLSYPYSGSEFLGIENLESMSIGDTIDYSMNIEIPDDVNQYMNYIYLHPVESQHPESFVEFNRRIPVAIQEFSNTSSGRPGNWNIYRSHGLLMIQVGKTFGDNQIVSLYDLSGRQIWNTPVNLQEDKQTGVSLPAISDGIYILEISDGPRRVRKKLFIK